MREVNERLVKENQDLERQNFEMDNMIIDLQTRSMNDNLIFYGIPEKVNTPQDKDPEDCTELVKDLISTNMEIDTTNMKFIRAHRLGSKTGSKSRGIVVKFAEYEDRELVRKTSYNEDIKQKLKNAKQGVGVQRPLTSRDARKAFEADFEDNAKDGKTVRQQGRKLYVNGKLTKIYKDGKAIPPPKHMLPTNK